MIFKLQYAHSSVRIRPVVLDYSFQSSDPIIEIHAIQISQNFSQNGLDEFLQRRESLEFQIFHSLLQVTK
jgi:hypothetical protein